jgi:hypothetical protein
MKSILLVMLAFAFAAPVALAQRSAATSPPMFFEKEYLFEVARHLYRWYLDETDFGKLVDKPDVVFWVRERMERMPKLDPGDKSRFGEIVVPDLNVRVTVKKADYTIEELGVVVKHDTFKVINVARGGLPADSAGYKVVTTSYQAMRDYAHRTRTLARFPDEALLMRLRLCARERISKHLESHEEGGLESRIGTLDELKSQEQVVHLSPLSNVTNELWVFWETGRMLIQFNSDMDLENTGLWDHDELVVKLYNIDQQTVVSLDEVAGSNAYMTRDRVGRVLFNCIILGRRLILQSLDDTTMEDNTRPRGRQGKSTSSR